MCLNCRPWYRENRYRVVRGGVLGRGVGLMCTTGVEDLVLMLASRRDAVLSLPAERRWHSRLRPTSARAPVAVTRHYKLVPHWTVNSGGATTGLVFDGMQRKCRKLMSAVSAWPGTKRRIKSQVERIGREGRGGVNFHQSIQIVAQEVP